ncbi:MAG: hypothetical protein ABIQ10_09115 [Gemmatimonadaceae bacterium]
MSHGHVVAEELERDHGRIIYSFEARVPGKSGISEVNVDAGDGKVLGVHPRVSGGPSEGGTRRQRGCEEGGNVALEAARVNDTFE